MVTAPKLYRPFARASSTLRRSSEEKSIERLYASIDDADVSHDVLGRHPIGLAVLPVRGCERSELGEPTRVIRLIRSSGISPCWPSASVPSLLVGRRKIRLQERTR